MASDREYDMGEEENFEELLDAYEKKGSRQIRAGDRVQARVVSIGRESVFVDTGTVIDGVVDRAELTDEQGRLVCEVGDILELYVISVSEGELRLSKAVSGAGGIRALKEAYENQVPVEGKVRCKCKGGFEVSVMQKRAFCPASQMDLRYAEVPEDYVGKNLRFLVTQFEEGGKNIVLSRRRLLEKELEKAREEFLVGLKEGELLEGKVSRLAPFGAFVEVFPGIEGLVHVSQLSWSRTNDPEEILNIGQNVKVKVLGLERDEVSGKTRISLSIKEVSDDPWEKIHDLAQEGQVLEGKVTRCVAFGAFVEIFPGVEGLVHISEMSYARRVVKPEEVVQVGDTVKVMVKEVDKENRRLSLSLKDVEGDPWADVTERYKEGQVIEGRLEKKERFGYLVSVEPGVTGLMPRESIERSMYGQELEKIKEGSILRARIQKIDQPGKKITLVPAEREEEGNWQEFRQPRASFGSLGEKLMQAMKNKQKRR